MYMYTVLLVEHQSGILKHMRLNPLTGFLFTLLPWMCICLSFMYIVHLHVLLTGVTCISSIGWITTDYHLYSLSAPHLLEQEGFVSSSFHPGCHPCPECPRWPVHQSVAELTGPGHAPLYRMLSAAYLVAQG